MREIASANRPDTERTCNSGNPSGRGTVSVVNTLGSSVLENPGLLPFLPRLAQTLLGAELEMPSIPTWWCGEDAGLDHANCDGERFGVIVGSGIGGLPLIEEMGTRGYWTSPGGKTPHATLYSAILREIDVKGDKARFKKTDRGQFAYNAAADSAIAACSVPAF